MLFILFHSVTWTDNFLRVGNAHFLFSPRNMWVTFFIQRFFFNVFLFFERFLRFLLITQRFLQLCVIPENVGHRRSRVKQTLLLDLVQNSET